MQVTITTREVSIVNREATYRVNSDEWAEVFWHEGLTEEKALSKLLELGKADFVYDNVVLEKTITVLDESGVLLNCSHRHKMPLVVKITPTTKSSTAILWELYGHVKSMPKTDN